MIHEFTLVLDREPAAAATGQDPIGTEGRTQSWRFLSRGAAALLAVIITAVGAIGHLGYRGYRCRLQRHGVAEGHRRRRWMQLRVGAQARPRPVRPRRVPRPSSRRQWALFQ